MDEYVDILDEQGAPTGKTTLKSEAHRKGLFHPTVHVWFYTPNGKVLIQQRSSNKDTHPSLWDVSVAGHLGAGENIISGALREVKEEIGLEVTPADLEKIGVFKSVHIHSKDLADCEFHHSFIAPLKRELGSLKKQDSEVVALKLIPLIQFAEETWGLARLQKYVPHSPDYYQAVTRAIKSKL